MEKDTDYQCLHLFVRFSLLPFVCSPSTYTDVPMFSLPFCNAKTICISLWWIFHIMSLFLDFQHYIVFPWGSNVMMLSWYKIIYPLGGRDRYLFMELLCVIPSGGQKAAKCHDVWFAAKGNVLQFHSNTKMWNLDMVEWTPLRARHGASGVKIDPNSSDISLWCDKHG